MIEFRSLSFSLSVYSIAKFCVNICLPILYLLSLPLPLSLLPLSLSISLTWHVGQFAFLFFVYLPFAIAATIDCLFPLGALYESNHYTFLSLFHCVLNILKPAQSVLSLSVHCTFTFYTHICYAPVDRLPWGGCLACQWRQRKGFCGEIDAHRHTEFTECDLTITLTGVSQWALFLFYSRHRQLPFPEWESVIDGVRGILHKVTRRRRFCGRLDEWLMGK